ncbi:MAG: hypothetical protein ACRECO_04100 [Xanthobacteraceae bacterium]
MRLGRSLLIAATAVLLSTATGVASASSIGPGLGRVKVNLHGLQFDVFTYRPDCPDPNLLLVFHGLNRNAQGYNNRARILGDKLCMIVVTPLFDSKRFPSWRYQRAGVVRGNTVQKRSDWTARYVFDLIAWVRREEGRPLRYAMIGHSAGAQFLSRLAAFTPTEAQRIVIANPSTYVFATTRRKAPYGFGGVYRGAAEETMLRRYLKAPVTIYLGKEDVGDENRNDSREARAQGKTRYDRGRNAFRTARALARKRNWEFNWRLVELPGVGHSSGRMFRASQALDALAR